jgi:hypothetical protein
MNRIIATKEKKYVWKISENDRCEYCDEVETIEHFFYKCEISNSFWKHIERWLGAVLNIKLHLSMVDILFGVPCESDKILFCINYVLLQGKKYLYHKRQSQASLFFLEYVQDLKLSLEVEHANIHFIDNAKYKVDGLTFLHNFI